MKSFSLLAITALMMSGAAMAQTQGPSATSSSTTGTDGSQPNSTAAPASVTPTSPVSNVTSQGTASTSTQSSTSATTSTSPQSSTSSSPSSTSSTAASPSTSSSTTASAQPKLIEQKVDLTTEPGPPADKRAARAEAVNALAWMKREGCRSDPSPRDCVRKAQDDYKETMARLGSGGSMSASGTSDASGERAGRSDRN
jgi:hypothetical protein